MRCIRPCGLQRLLCTGSWFGESLNDTSLTSAAYNAGYTWWGDFIFQAMFAATGATIVSGAVAERVKLPILHDLLGTACWFCLPGHR